jgi:hypothetical protein
MGKPPLKLAYDKAIVQYPHKPKGVASFFLPRRKTNGMFLFVFGEYFSFARWSQFATTSVLSAAVNWHIKSSDNRLFAEKFKIFCPQGNSATSCCRITGVAL